MINTLLLVGQAIDFATVGLAVAIMVGVALVMGVCILLISKLCHVEQDSRIAEVEGCLAGANCGACGCAGCSDFAKKLVEGKADISSCSVTSTQGKTQISSILGIAQDNSIPTVAVVACCGGNKANDKCDYVGNSSCASQKLVVGGKKVCDVACLGGGDCKDACPYDAIEIVDGKAVINPVLCRSCGLCIKTCPNKLISRVPQNAAVYIACSNKCRGKDVMGACQVGCIACGKCARECPNGAITMVDNLPVIDYSKCTNCGNCAQTCPRHCIAYLHGEVKTTADANVTKVKAE